LGGSPQRPAVECAIGAQPDFLGGADQLFHGSAHDPRYGTANTATVATIGEIPAGEIRHGEIPHGEIPHDEIRHGEIRFISGDENGFTLIWRPVADDAFALADLLISIQPIRFPVQSPGEMRAVS
jgi:hypothetical protein